MSPFLFEGRQEGIVQIEEHKGRTTMIMSLGFQLCQTFLQQEIVERDALVERGIALLEPICDSSAR